MFKHSKYASQLYNLQNEIYICVSIFKSLDYVIFLNWNCINLKIIKKLDDFYGGLLCYFIL